MEIIFPSVDERWLEDGYEMVGKRLEGMAVRKWLEDDGIWLTDGWKMVERWLEDGWKL